MLWTSCNRCLFPNRGSFRATTRPLSTQSSKAHGYRYLVERVKKYDYENYLICLLSPKSYRHALFVIHAYNVELSLVLESANERKASLGRFSFWSEALKSVYAGERPFDHPVVEHLSSLHKQSFISSQQAKRSLLNMLTARQSISSVTHLETLDQLEVFAEHTRSSLIHLTLTIAGQSNIDSDHAASHLGRCGGLLNALRATPYLASRNQLLLPQDILSKHKVSQTDVLRGKDTLVEPVFEIASQAHIHLEKAKELISKLPKEGKRCFLPVVLYEYQLQLLRECNFNLFHPSFQKKNPRLPWKLWWAKFKI